MYHGFQHQLEMFTEAPSQHIQMISEGLNKHSLCEENFQKAKKFLLTPTFSIVVCITTKWILLRLSTIVHKRNLETQGSHLLLVSVPHQIQQHQHKESRFKMPLSLDLIQLTPQITGDSGGSQSYFKHVESASRHFGALTI